MHLLSQRPLLTGSGITLDAYLRQAAAAGWEQQVAVGIPHDEPITAVGGISPEQVRPLHFGEGVLDFPVPGMSDVMPYTNTRFSSMTSRMIDNYRRQWSQHVARLLADFRPQLIHSHHIWILSSLLKDLAPEIPVITSCHATGLRQLELAPHLAEGVVAGCRRNDLFLAMHGKNADQLAQILDIERERVRILPPGYREDIFHSRGRTGSGGEILFVGKYADAKGLHSLLDACEELLGRVSDLKLHVAGGGEGDEADALRARMAGSAPWLQMHGQLSQGELADLMRSCRLLVLPSFYEGIPLVLVEALACGCRLLATDLPGIRAGLSEALGDHLTLLPAPAMIGIDRPDPEALQAFRSHLIAGIEQALDLGDLPPDPNHPAGGLDRFSWSAVFERLQEIWLEALEV